MQRRSWLKLGLASATVLGLGGGVVALFEPGLQDGRLSPAGRDVFAGAARGLLDGTLPNGRVEMQAEIDGLLLRIDVLASGLTPHAQTELSQLLALLGTAPGRRGLTGLSASWHHSTVPEIQAAFQFMRTSGVSLRQQTYQALHDIVGSAYFSDASTWVQLGYPGPLKIFEGAI